MDEKEALPPATPVQMERKLTTILSADVKGYSRLMGADDEATVRTLTARRALMTTLIQQHRGRVVDSPGDNLLAEFVSVVDAVRCVVAIAPLKQYLTQYPNHLDAHLPLAAVYSDLGKEAEARAEAAEVLQINPRFSLEVNKERVPIKDPALLEQHIAALRKAGLK